MRIIYTNHLKEMMRVRQFPQDYPETIYFAADKRYFDRSTKSLIAIKQLTYKSKLRKIVIAYVIEDENVKILTIYAEKDKDIKKRIINGRWIKL